MAHNVHGFGRLALTGGVGTVGVTVYETGGSVAVARTTAGIAELIANSGLYVATVSVADPRRPLWMVFDDAAGQVSTPFLCGSLASDMYLINGNADAALRLNKSANAIVLGVAGPGASTTVVPTSSLLPVADTTDQFKGRVLLFDMNTATVSLRGQGGRVVSSSNAGVLTVTQLTTAPASGDTFTLT